MYYIGKDDFYGKKGRHFPYKRRHLQKPASSAAGTGGSDEKHRTEPHRGRDTCPRPRQVFLPESVGRVKAKLILLGVQWPNPKKNMVYGTLRRSWL
jgi:hypothetical protein